LGSGDDCATIAHATGQGGIEIQTVAATHRYHRLLANLHHIGIQARQHQTIVEDHRFLHIVTVQYGSRDIGRLKLGDQGRIHRHHGQCAA
jgi:hypothetical protein